MRSSLSARMDRCMCSLRRLRRKTWRPFASILARSVSSPRSRFGSSRWYRLQDQGLVVPTENVMGPNPENTDAEIRPANLHKLVTENECPLVVANGQILVELPHFTDRGGKAWRWQEKGQNLVTYLRDRS